MQTLDGKRKHFDEKIIKARKHIGIIKHLSRFLPLKTLNQMYKVFVRSHLDYCDIIYHQPAKCCKISTWKLNDFLKFDL